MNEQNGCVDHGWRALYSQAQCSVRFFEKNSNGSNPGRMASHLSTGVPPEIFAIPDQKQCHGCDFSYLCASPDCS